MKKKWINRFFMLVISTVILSCSKEKLEIENIPEKSKVQTLVEDEGNSQNELAVRNSTIIRELWAIGRDQRVYRYNWDTERFYQPNPSVRLVEVAVGREREVWGLSSSRRIYKYDWSSMSWFEPDSDARADNLAVAGSGIVYATANSRKIYKWNSNSGSWSLPNSSARASTINVSLDGVLYATNLSDKVYTSVNDGTSWSLYTSRKFDSVVGSYGGTVYGLRDKEAWVNFGPDNWRRISDIGIPLILDLATTGARLFALGYHPTQSQHGGEAYVYENGIWRKVHGGLYLVQISAGR